MYIAYLDESGTDDKSTVVTVVGLLVAGQRRGRSSDLFNRLLATASDTAKPGLQEFKGADLYAGKGKWHKVNPDERVAIIDNIVEFAVERKHSLLLGAVEKGQFNADAFGFMKPRPDERAIAALHCVLQAERHQGKKDGRKGDTLFLFDQHRGNDHLTTYLLRQPTEVREYRGPKTESCIVETPMSVKSDLVGMIQIADVYAFVLRRYAELRAGVEPQFNGEDERIGQWTQRLADRLLPKADRWPASNAGPLPALLQTVTPDSLHRLGKRQPRSSQTP